MSIEENKALYRRYIEEFWNKGNLAVTSEVLTSNCIIHEPIPIASWTPKTVVELKERAKTIRTAIPDFHITIEDIIAEGDKIAARVTLRGTQKGEFMEIAPTGKKFTIKEIEFSRVEDGKLAELWPLIDNLNMLQELGVISPPQIKW